jgi:hypothetical protein
MPINFDAPDRTPSLAARIVATVLGVIAFGAAMMFSVVVFAGLALAVLVFGGYLWWKTRALRRTLREQRRDYRFEPPDDGMAGKTADGANVIEGEAVRVDEDRPRLE